MVRLSTMFVTDTATTVLSQISVRHWLKIMDCPCVFQILKQLVIAECKMKSPRSKPNKAGDMKF